MRNFKPLAIALVVTAACCPAAQARVEMSAGVSGLQFQLIDLLPDDGIAPQINFVPAENAGVYNSVGISPDSLGREGTWESREQILKGSTFQPLNGTASLPTANSTSSVSRSGSLASGRIDSPYEPGHEMAADFYSSAGDGTSFTLSPGTKLVITGLLFSSYSSDEPLHPSSSSYGFTDFESHTSVYLFAPNKDGDEWGGDQFNWPGLDQVDFSHGPAGKSESRAFEVSVSNLTHDFMEGRYSNSASVNAHTYVFPWTPAVPEVETYLMMLSGLVAVGVASGRRRYKK